MWGIVPAAGLGSRIQPLAFSKELLPVGSRRDQGRERPRAVSEYLIERMLKAGVTRLCMVISPGKSDLVAYYGAGIGGVPVCYVVQPEPAGLCDAVFRALPLIGAEERVIIGLPDTVWFPDDALSRLGDQALSFLLFPVEHPERFDAVVTDEGGRVLEIQVKQEKASTPWVWGALKLHGSELAALHRLYLERDRQDVYLGTLVNAHLARGGSAWAVRAGEAYVDVGTLDGYREAMRLLEGKVA
jgi:glucose-1-phosphate thymidylyltransferase